MDREPDVCGMEIGVEFDGGIGNWTWPRIVEGEAMNGFLSIKLLVTCPCRNEGREPRDGGTTEAETKGDKEALEVDRAELPTTPAEETDREVDVNPSAPSLPVISFLGGVLGAGGCPKPWPCVAGGTGM